MEHIYIDFQGTITIDQIRQFLRDDESRESRALLAKLIEDRGIDDLLVTLADCLRDHLATGLTQDVVKDQLITYGES